MAFGSFHLLINLYFVESPLAGNYVCALDVAVIEALLLCPPDGRRERTGGL